MSDDQNEERLAAIAFILDRLEHFEPASTNRVFALELATGLAEGRHLDCARAGEYADQNWRVQLIMMARKLVTPSVRRSKLKALR